MNRLEELFKEYNELCENNKLDYQPDGFLIHIHEHYIRNGKIRLPYPLYVTWDITNYCNLHCYFCSASALGNGKKVDDLNTIEIAKKLISNGIKYVSIRGGEPTLVKQLPEIINLFSDNGIYTELVTNGSGITKTFLNKIKNVNKNLLRIKISLDSTDEQINDKIRGRGSYKMATSAIETCNKEKWPYRVQMVITETNRHTVLDMYKYVSENNATSFGTQIVLPMGRAKKTDMFKIDEKLLEDLIYIKKNETNTIFEKLGMGLDGYNFYDFLYKDTKFTEEDSYIFSLLKCNCGKTRINVDANGDVYPCDMTKYPEFKMGNILENTVEEYWNSENVNKFNTLSRKTKTGCKDCKNFGCNTGCFGMSYGIFRDIEKTLPNCKIYED